MCVLYFRYYYIIYYERPSVTSNMVDKDSRYVYTWKVVTENRVTWVLMDSVVKKKTVK